MYHQRLPPGKGLQSLMQDPKIIKSKRLVLSMTNISHKCKLAIGEITYSDWYYFYLYLFSTKVAAEEHNNSVINMKSLILRINQGKVRPQKEKIDNNEREAIIQRIKEAVKRKWVVKLSRISPMAIKIYSSAAENRTKKFCGKVNIYARKHLDP